MTRRVVCKRCRVFGNRLPHSAAVAWLRIAYRRNGENVWQYGRT